MYKSPPSDKSWEHLSQDAHDNSSSDAHREDLDRRENSRIEQILLEVNAQTKLRASHLHEDGGSLDNERENIEELPDAMREKRTASRHKVFPDQRSDKESDEDDQRSDEDDKIPAANGCMSETEDEENKAAHEEESATEIHILQFGGTRQVISNSFGLGHEIPCENREGCDDDGYEKRCQYV